MEETDTMLCRWKQNLYRSMMAHRGLWVIGIFVGMVVAQFILACFGVLSNVVAQIIVDVIGGGMGLLLYCWMTRTPDFPIRFHTIGFGDVIFMSVMCAVVWYGQVSLLVFLMQNPFIAEAMASSAVEPTIGWCFLVLIVAPICEEVLCRGGLQGVLATKTKLPVWAIVCIQAMVFAFMHLGGINVPAMFGLGLVLGAVVWKTGRLWPAVGLHFLFNLTNVALGDVAVPSWFGDPTVFCALFVVAISLTLLWVGWDRHPEN